MYMFQPPDSCFETYFRASIHDLFVILQPEHFYWGKYKIRQVKRKVHTCKVLF